MRVLTTFFLLLSLISPACLMAEDTPLATVQTAISKVMTIIDDVSLQGEASKTEQVKQIEVIVDKVFDYEKLSRQALGKNWNGITADQQQEFVKLFSKFLGQVYITKITSFPGSKIDFVGEVSLSPTVSEVRTQVLTKEAKVPINYRLTNSEHGWRVYDVIVEGVSLLNNYRSQFHSILTNKPMEDLLAQLRAKVASYGS